MTQDHLYLPNQEQDLTKGGIGKELWSLAWPMMLSVFFYTLYNIVDAYWVSKLSPEAIAAVSISQISLFVMISLGFGITAGSGVLMAMKIGAKNYREAEKILGQAFMLSAVLAFFFTIVALVFRHELLAFSGASGAILAPALEYFTITAAGSLLLFLLITVMFVFNSQGDTNTLTKFFALSTAINLLLDPVLIFGFGPIPAFGIGGAAIATLISQFIFLLVAVRSLSDPSRHIRFRWENLGLRWSSVKKVLEIGLPASLTQIIFPIGLSLLTTISSLAFFEAGTIAFSLGFRIEFFAYLPAVGFGFAAMAMIGQSMGAQNFPRARRCFRHAIIAACGGSALLGLLAAIFAGPLIRFFTVDPEVIRFAYSYFWSVPLSYGFLSATMVAASSFQALGRSWPGFWLFFLRIFGISVPLAYFLCLRLELPIIALWTAIIAGNIISGVLGYLLITKELSLRVEKQPSS